MVVLLLVPLGRCDPAHLVLSTRPALKPLGRADPNRQRHRQGAAHSLCLQPACMQLSPAGKAASASAVCEHEQLLGACSETPARAVQLPAPLFQSTMKAEGWLKASCLVGREAWSSVLQDEPVLTPWRGARLGCREKGSIRQAHWGPCHETLLRLLTSQTPPKCRAGDEGSNLPVHSPYVGLVWLGMLPCGRVCPHASSSQSSPIPFQAHHLLQHSPRCIPEGCPGLSSIAGKGSGIALHLHVAVKPLSATGHLLSPTINWIHFTAGTKAGCLPGLELSLLLVEAGMGLSLMLELQTKPNVPRTQQDQPVLVLLYTSC